MCFVVSEINSFGEKKSSLPHHVTQIIPRDRQGAKDGCSRLWLSIFFWELNAPGVGVGIGDSQYPPFTFPGMELLMKSYGWTTEIIRATVYALYCAFCEPLVSWAESQREAFKDTKYSATTAGSGDAIRDAWLYSREGTSLYWLFVNWEEGSLWSWIHRLGVAAQLTDWNEHSRVLGRAKNFILNISLITWENQWLLISVCLAALWVVDGMMLSSPVFCGFMESGHPGVIQESRTRGLWHINAISQIFKILKLTKVYIYI